MEKWKQTKLDDPSMWPNQTMVELDEPHVDARGAIQSLVNLPMKNVSLITSKKGTLRSNHYHKTDWHYMYVLSGSFEYYFREHGSDAKPEMVVAKAGDMLFTPPMEDHTTIFLEDTSFLALSRNPRDQEAYEADVERIALVDPANYIV